MSDNNKNSFPMEDTGRRFDRVARLVGPAGLEKLRKAHVMVIGCGGVGSWAAEMIARSAVGRISLVDFDTVCIRNFNRQLQALDGDIGKPKVKLLAERFKRINPEARVDGLNEFFSETTCPALLGEKPDFVIDAIDHVTSKCFLINHCHANNIPLIVSTGSGGRIDPTQVRVTDLGITERDPLARAVRKILREKYAFPRKGKFGVQAVCTLEQDRKPHDSVEATDCKAGCLCPQGENGLHSCTKKSVVLGTAGFVTGAFGMACASAAIRHLCGEI